MSEKPVEKKLDAAAKTAASAAAAAAKSETNPETKPLGPDGKPKLSNKELKELKKKEKLEKRAAAKQAAGIIDQGDQSQKKKEAVATKAQKQSIKEAIKAAKKPKKIALFSHLETKEQRNESSLTSSQISNLIHPVILSLTLKYSSYSIVGSIPRCKAMLKAFQRVIKEYQTPKGTTLSRNLTNYLSNQIDYLKTARPLSVTMGNAIRWLKQEISYISIDKSDTNAKEEIIDKIDNYIREKIELSDKVIIQNASAHIQNNSTILTFANSQVLKELFLYNHDQGKRFNVIVVDSRPLFEGKKLAQELTSHGLRVHYVLINAISTVFQDVDFVFLGAHAMLSNGFLYSRVGSALIAMKAKNKNIPVLVCCESIKFSDRVQLDSVTLNELGDDEDLFETSGKKKSVALKKFIETHQEVPQQQGKQQQQKGKKIEPEEIKDKDTNPLANWKEKEFLNVLNIMYDLTPPEYIQKIITEVGALPSSSVPVILREYKSST